LTWLELLQIGDGLLLVGLIVWLAWSKGRELREQRAFQRRMDERTQQLMEYTVRRVVDAATPEKEGKHE
jgi:ABC-type nickel/cobalt efflux system permease component RcnA